MIRHPVFLVVGLLVAAAANAETVTRAILPERHRALLERHCVKCHGTTSQEGGVRLDDLPFAIADVKTAERWQKVLGVLNAGEMPPADEPQPEPAAKADMIDAVSTTMVVARKSLSDRGGLITMRRLNRREYANTLRELLGVGINVAELPADTSGTGFDTVGANLFMSADQFEQYRSLGRDALDEAFDRRMPWGGRRTLRYEAETILRDIVRDHANELDAEARAHRWIAAVDAAAAMSENAETVARIRSRSKNDAEFRRAWREIKGAPPPEDYGFRTVEENSDKANRAANYSTDYFAAYRNYYFALPHLDTGAYLATNGLTTSLSTTLSNWWPGGYVVRVRLAAVPDAPPERRFVEFGTRPRAGRALATFEVTGTFDAPQIIEIPFSFTRKHTDPQDRTIFFREKGTQDHFEQTRLVFDRGKKANGIGPPVAIWVDWIEVERLADQGPPAGGLTALDPLPIDDGVTDARGKIVPHAIAAADLRGAIERFCTEAFRGTAASTAFVDRLAARYDDRRRAGDGHAAALKETLALVLSSPMFLYLSEPDPSGTHRPLTGPELATRLSYFLWGAPPDPGLRQLGATGALLRPEVLAGATDRLLDDPRSAGFVRPFVHQWLGLDRLDFFEFDRRLYPRFDVSTKMAAREEVFETFRHLVATNGSVRELLASDQAVVNAVLASYYGLEGVHGDSFRPVRLPPESPRGGLLGMAAILAMGGNGESTNPVERGAWVLRKMLDDPPPPAPANVPQIARLSGKTLTTRERLALHQEAPQCTGCHRKIDPIGFGLENFDAVGQWRMEDSYQATTAEGKPDPKQKKLTWRVDAAGGFHDGPAFEDFFAMRRIVAGREHDFARGLSKALVEYGLGRPVGFSDDPLVDTMVSAAEGAGFGTRTLVHTLVQSASFRTK